ncbi:MAG: UDP-N-acetylmuramate dehydrogenase [Ignavibacteriales bacterium]
MENKEIYFKKIRDDIGIKNIHINEPMNKHTSFRVGGPADIFAAPANIDELKSLIAFVKQEGIPMFIIGNGSNLVVKDGGIRGIVINILDNFNNISVKNDIIEADTGVLLSKLSNVAMKNSLSGLEFASGIPGTLGGAVVMNAGAYGEQIGDLVVKSEYIDMDGTIHELDGNAQKFGYRKSFYSDKKVIVIKAALKLVMSDMAEIKEKMTNLMLQRNEKQPLAYPSAGSVFKRPEGYFAGKLIEDAGLKGIIHGGAQISDKHTGFIINRGKARASDIIHLIEYAKEIVKIKFGVELETEVKIIGED